MMVSLPVIGYSQLRICARKFAINQPSSSADLFLLHCGEFNKKRSGIKALFNSQIIMILL